MDNNLKYWLDEYGKKFGLGVNLIGAPSEEAIIKEMKKAIESGEPIPEPPPDVEI